MMNAPAREVSSETPLSDGGAPTRDWTSLPRGACPLAAAFAFVVATLVLLTIPVSPRALYYLPPSLLPPTRASLAPLRVPAPLLRSPQHPRGLLPVASAVDTTAPAEIRDVLARRFPGASLTHFTDDFLGLMHKKYGDSATEKMEEVLQWRIRTDVDRLSREQPRLSADVMFWHGHDKQRRPLLYLRPGLMDMTTYNASKTEYTVTALIEEGVDALGPGVAEFVLVIDTSGVGPLHFNPLFIQPIVSLAVDGYRHRIHRVLVGPTDPFVNSLWAFIDTLLPADFRSKVLLTSQPRVLLAQQVDSLPTQRLF